MVTRTAVGLFPEPEPVPNVYEPELDPWEDYYISGYDSAPGYGSRRRPRNRALDRVPWLPWLRHSRNTGEPGQEGSIGSQLQGRQRDDVRRRELWRSRLRLHRNWRRER